MTTNPRKAVGIARPWRGAAATLIALATTACGGGSSNPFDNPPAVVNSDVVGGQKLSFAYFQRCIDPIFRAQLPIQLNGAASINTCAGAGCHAAATGTGGSFRVESNPQLLDLTDPANTPAVLRASDMYKDYYSAQGAVVLGAPTQSRLLAKPLLLGVLHGGGLVFPSQSDPNAKLIAYWIGHPMPLGQDEFSSAGNALFTPANAQTGTCNSQ